MKVFSRNRRIILDDDCVSIGAAARGHILEPYAIDLWNHYHAPTIYHWDDILVAEDFIGYSPDGLDVPMPKTYMPKINKSWIKPTYLTEVKCYNNESHWTKGHSNKHKLEERWQIATAMAVNDTIMYGDLLLYNPSSTDQLYVHQYHRDDLLDEIDIIHKIKDDWIHFLEEEASGRFSVWSVNGDLSEEDIWNKEELKKGLNPQ